jgi:hypothetical protein
VVGDEIITYEESHVVVTNHRQAYNKTVVDVGDNVQFADLMSDNVEEFFVNIPLEDLDLLPLLFQTLLERSL